jgi:proline racemase/trans-L-3-hydroxyproline dehydratase
MFINKEEERGRASIIHTAYLSKRAGSSRRNGLLKSVRHIFAVDSHTLGEPTRVVVGGLGPVPGCSMRAKRDYLAANLDYLRTALMHEPRGHRDMFGAILCDPADGAADLGVIFMDGGGYLNMCGHGSIGTVMVALEMGIVAAQEPVTHLTLDTPAGLIKARAEVSGGKTRNVTIRNVHSFLLAGDEPMEVPGMGIVRADIAYGGNFFALVDAVDLGIEIRPENGMRLVDAGMRVLDATREALTVRHPADGLPGRIDLVEICGPPVSPGADARNVVIFGDGQFDRSPCGTGTCARMAALHAKGRLPLGKEFVNESMLGTMFRGRLVEESTINGRTGVVPEITASAYITGIQQFVIDPDDPFRHGFRIDGPVTAAIPRVAGKYHSKGGVI